MSLEAGIAILVEAWEIVERKTVETLAKISCASCASCPSMSINPLLMRDLEPVSNYQSQAFVI